MCGFILLSCVSFTLAETKESDDPQINFENKLKKISKINYRSGILGGGFRDLKWGMIKDDVENIISSYNENGKLIYCRYYEEAFLYSVHITINEGYENINTLLNVFKKKYGKYSTSKDEKVGKSAGGTTWRVRKIYYTWSDKVTKIEMMNEIDSPLDGDNNSEHSHIEIEYSSIIISKLIDLNNQEENKLQEQNKLNKY